MKKVANGGQPSFHHFTQFQMLKTFVEHSLLYEITLG